MKFLIAFTLFLSSVMAVLGAPQALNGYGGGLEASSPVPYGYADYVSSEKPALNGYENIVPSVAPHGYETYVVSTTEKPRLNGY